MTSKIQRVFTVNEWFAGFLYHQNNDILILFNYIRSKATAFQLVELKMIILHTQKIHTHWNWNFMPFFI